MVVQTLRGLAREVLQRAEQPVPGADPLLRLLVRREARREPALREPLEELRDGYVAVIASVEDLFDAGFEPANLAGHLDALAESAGPEALRARAAALVKVAARTARTLEGWGRAHRAFALARAAELLADRPELLPARAVHVHGFADVTGAAGALLEALVRTHGARVLLDHPPDPADPLRGDAGAEFTAPLRARLAGWAPRPREPEAAAPAPELSLLEAPGADAEARGVADRVRACLDAGAPPERIGIVARELAPYAVPLRRHLGRLAIPYSGATGAALLRKPGARVLRSFLDLLRERRVGVGRRLARRAGRRAGGRGTERDDRSPRRLPHPRRRASRRRRVPRRRGAPRRQGVSRAPGAAGPARGRRRRRE